MSCVTPDWAEKNLGTQGIVLLEVDEDAAAPTAATSPSA